MKVWQLVSPKNLIEDERPEKINNLNQAKIKVTKALLSDVDALAFSGEIKVKYPIILGRFAIGKVIEAPVEDNCGICKNDRVYLNAVTPCYNCANCKTQNVENCVSLNIAGSNVDGFLRDFAVVNSNDITALPSSVTDEQALYVEPVALGEAIIDALKISKGQHVAIIGATACGIILSQLLIYHQAVPILIDKNSDALELAKQCGIYYTLLADESLHDKIFQITGGRLTNGAVYMTNSKLDTSLPFDVSSNLENIVYAGFSYSKIIINLDEALKKNIKIIGVTNGYGYTSSAINLLANHVIDLSKFEMETVNYDNLPKLFEERVEQISENKLRKAVIVNLL